MQLKGPPMSHLFSPTIPRHVADTDTLVTRTIGRLGVVLEVHGEVDLATAPRITRSLRQALRFPVEAVTLDLSDVTFMDSQGAHLLEDARVDAGERGVALVVASASRPVLRVLELVGIAAEFHTRAP
jgi:anti-anti-sigma factor